MQCTQSLPVDVGVALGRGQGRVAQQFLDRAQVGPALDQMGGKAVPELMWTDRDRQARFLCQLVEDAVDADPIQGPTVSAEEEFRALSLGPGRQDGSFQVQVEFQRLLGRGGNGDQTFLAALAEDPDEREVETQGINRRRARGGGLDFAGPGACLGGSARAAS